MNRTLRFLLVLAATAAFVFGALAMTTFAAPLAPAGVSPSAAVPDVSRFDNALDAAEMDEVVDIVERLDQYLYVGDDGLVHLRDVSAAELGVSETFLANFKSAMSFSNAAIQRGEFVVNKDMTVQVTDPTTIFTGGVNPAPPGGATVDAAPETAVPDTAVPDWGAWRYNSGCMFYNSYSTYNQYRYNYYTLCNSMASYVGYPWISPSLMNFYGYNQSYMNNYCYNPGGSYYYLPYSSSSSCSSSYNPCYGNMGYKPAYFWVRSYSYNSSCRCNNYNYNWQGYWARY